MFENYDDFLKVHYFVHKLLSPCLWTTLKIEKVLKVS